MQGCCVDCCLALIISLRAWRSVVCRTTTTKRQQTWSTHKTRSVARGCGRRKETKQNKKTKHSNVPNIPYLHRSILRACVHPFAFLLETDSRHIAGVAIETSNRIRTGRVNGIEADQRIAGHCQILLVCRNTKLVHLRVLILERAITATGRSLPKPDRMVIPSRTQHDTLKATGPLLSILRSHRMQHTLLIKVKLAVI